MSGDGKQPECGDLSDNELFEDALEVISTEDKGPIVDSHEAQDSSCVNRTSLNDTPEKHVQTSQTDNTNTENSCDSDEDSEGLEDEGIDQEPLPPSYSPDDDAAASDLHQDATEDEDKDAEDEVVKQLQSRDAELTEEQLQEYHNQALELKVAGNETFKAAEYEDAVVTYTEALLVCPLCHAKDRSILFSNRAACYLRLEKNEKAISDCTRALELNPNYLKALLRRAELYEKTEKLDEALTDYQKALELDPSLFAAREACMRLPDAIKERNEKMKDEMMGKLKELGNMVLRPFGLSTNNFNLQQDPNTGSYSVQFQQNQQATS